MKLHAALERWEFKTPFRITGYTWDHLEVVLVRLERNGAVGHAEAAGVYYKRDTPGMLLEQLESLRPQIEAGLSREALQALLPPCGARNALDCALWDLEAKLSGQPVWRMVGIRNPQPRVTTFTCGAAEPESMAATAKSYVTARAIKLKLTGEPVDSERVRAVREARSDVWLGVDANQGFTRESLDRLLPVLVQAGVALIEQPFPLGREVWLDGLASPIPIAADESVQSLADLTSLVGRVQMINIKLDKCGGLTEALAMAHKARELGLRCMVGNMMGTSLAMAPAYVVGQLCEVVDLDGPVFLNSDRLNPVSYADGYIACPEILWGYP